jgi:hypothetical protein
VQFAQRVEHIAAEAATPLSTLVESAFKPPTRVTGEPARQLVPPPATAAPRASLEAPVTLPVVNHVNLLGTARPIALATTTSTASTTSTKVSETDAAAVPPLNSSQNPPEPDSSARTLDRPVPSFELTAAVWTPQGSSTPIALNASEPQSARELTLWGLAADGGVAVGKGSSKAAVATAGFFSRMAKSIAGSFKD